MSGRTLTLRLLALVFSLACAIFAVTAGYRALLIRTGPLSAPIVMAAVSAFLAVSLMVMAQIRASRRRAKLTAIMSNLIDHKPLAGLAAAVVAGAAARFGLEPDDLFPIFEAFNKESRSPQTQQPQPASVPPTTPEQSVF
jgi:hypothetical protein